MGAVVDQESVNGTALTPTALNCHLEVVDFLLSAGANINHLDIKGNSPLHAAACEGHLSVVKLLVYRVANIHQTSIQGLNSLQITALYGHNEIVDYLMSKVATFEAVGTIDKVCKFCGVGDATMKCARCFTV